MRALTEKHGSLPTRGAWIETVALSSLIASPMSLPTRGAWIETVWVTSRLLGGGGRSPHGERGLKHRLGAVFAPPLMSLPTRGAWIETPSRSLITLIYGGRSPHGERGLKPWRRGLNPHLPPVAPHTGSVD